VTVFRGVKASEQKFVRVGKEGWVERGGEPAAAQ
jgi:hypothetical protein